MGVRDACPGCGSIQFKKNGHIHSGKQNHRCKACGRQFVASAEGRIIADEQRTLVEHLLRERISLRGICRAVGVRLTWLWHFMVECFAACPDHLHAQRPAGPAEVGLHQLEAEADEVWSFVEKKANKPWLWIAMDATTRQIMAFHVGDRSRDSAQELWANIPAVYREQAMMLSMFYTRQHFALGGAVALELIRDEHPGHVLAPFQQLPEEFLRSLLVTPRLDQDVQHMPVLIHGAPQVVALAMNRQKHLVQVPLVTWSRAATAQLVAYSCPNFRHHFRMAS
jgi:insertion element IS1 protein InsB